MYNAGEDPLATQSMHIEVGGAAGSSAGPDAAAGGRRDADAAAGGRRSDCDVPRRGHVELRLPIEARAGSSIACTSLAELGRCLSDTAQLQSRAMAAIDRIAKQQAALRRFPIACPSCGALNAPCGLAWGAGDIVACSGCGHSFVSLANGLQDNDFSVLRMAVTRLRESEDRVQYLEHVVQTRAAMAPARSLPAVAANGGTASVPALAGATPRAAFGAMMPSPGLMGGIPDGRAALPVGIRSRSPAQLCKTPLRGTSPMRRPEAVGSRLRLQSSGPEHFALSPRSRQDDGGFRGEAARGPATPPDQTGGAPREPQLMSLFSTQDLMTNSTSESGHTPCIMGHKLQQRGQFDTIEHVHEAMECARSAMSAEATARSRCGAGVGLRGRGDREDGEITSEPDSVDMSSRSSFGRIRQQGSSPCRGSPPSGSPWCRLPSVPMSPAPSRTSLCTPSSTRCFDQVPSLRCIPDRRVRSSDTPEVAGLAAWFGDAQLRVSKHLLALFLAFVAVRTVVCRLVAALGLGAVMISSILTGLLTGASLMSYRTSMQALRVNRMLDTQTNWTCRSVTWKISLQDWTLWSYDFTLEEAFGCTCVLAQVTLFCFFENWGLRGPLAARWCAVVGHAGCVAIFMSTAESFLSRQLSSSSSCSTSVLWLFVTTGNWGTTSWAALTWWHSAAATSAAATPDEEEWPIPVHVVALAFAQLVNFWLARRIRQHELLSACVVLAGISMACSCFSGQGGIGVSPAASAKLWTPALYLGFCAMSIWVLWQEFLRSLDI